MIVDYTSTNVDYTLTNVDYTSTNVDYMPTSCRGSVESYIRRAYSVFSNSRPMPLKKRRPRSRSYFRPQSPPTPTKPHSHAPHAPPPLPNTLTRLCRGTGREVACMTCRIRRICIHHSELLQYPLIH